MTSPPTPKQPGCPEVTGAAAPFPSFAFLSLGSVLSLFSFLETQAWRRVFVTTGTMERAKPGSVLGYAVALAGDALLWVRWLLRVTVQGQGGCGEAPQTLGPRGRLEASCPGLFRKAGLGAVG